MDCYKELKDNNCKLQHCIELVVYDEINICTVGGEISLGINLNAYIDPVILLESDQSLCLEYISCMEGYVYEEFELSINDSICVLPICKGSLKISSEVIPTCTSYYKQVNNSLKMKLEKLLSLPSELEIYSLDLLLSNSSEFIPEIPQPIPFNTDTRQNVENQNSIKIRIIKSTTLCRGTTEERNLWLVSVVEYENVPVMLLFNHLYNSSQFVPYRYKLNKQVYIDMINFIHSLLVYEEDECSPYPLYNKELNVLSGKMVYPQRSVNTCDEQETVGLLECTELLEDEFDINVLEKDLDKFLSVYKVNS